MNLTTKHITRAVHEFYPDSTPKACGGKKICTESWKAMLVIQWSLSKNPHLQDYIYDSNVTMEVLLRNPVPSETMT